MAAKAAEFTRCLNQYSVPGNVQYCTNCWELAANYTASYTALPANCHVLAFKMTFDSLIMDDNSVWNTSYCAACDGVSAAAACWQKVWPASI